VPRGNALGGGAVEPDEDTTEHERADDGEQDAEGGTDELVDGGRHDEIDRGQREGTESRMRGRQHRVSRRTMFS
jgi:hypothetical protein